VIALGGLLALRRPRNQVGDVLIITLTQHTHAESTSKRIRRHFRHSVDYPASVPRPLWCLYSRSADFNRLAGASETPMLGISFLNEQDGELLRDVERHRG
jgi:hypothetical protein